jgi:pimeloyl-ACP methyl ester carboxylesterase
MTTEQLTAHAIQTPSGVISYTETGSGPVVLFVHGILMNKHLWRHQIAALSDIRRCIAVDLLAHGDTEIEAGHDVSVTANANMLREFIDAMGIDQVDLVGNDSGGGISQIFAALNPDRVRSLTLTDCDTHDNWWPEAFRPFVDMTLAGGLAETLKALTGDKSVYRSAQGLGQCYVDPNSVTDADIDIYLQPFLRNEQRTVDLQRFVASSDNSHTLRIEAQLRQLKAPTLLVWGTDDVYFPVKWAYWLAGAIPGAKNPVELPGGRLFFMEESPDEFNRLLRDHLLADAA